MLSVFVIGEIDEVGEAFLATPPWKSTTTLDRTAFTAFSTFWPAVSRNWCPGTPSHVAAVLMNGGLKAGKGGEAGDCGFRQTGPWRLRPRWFLTDCLKLLTR